MPIFKKILIVVDSSQSEHPELQRAMQLAQHGEVQLYLVDVMKDVSLTIRLLSRDYVHIHELLIKEKREQLQTLVDQCRAHSIEADGEVREGVSSQVTIEVALRIGADLIVRATKGIHSRQPGRLGTSSQKLIQRPPCPVWLAAPSREPNVRTIVATVDASPGDEAHQQLNRRIMQIAIALADRERAKLLVSYVWSLYGSEMLRHRLPASEFESLIKFNRLQHRQSFDALLSEFGLHVGGPASRMLEGEPSLAIPELCEKEDVDLLVCGTVARQGIPGLLLGNTAERIVQRVPCSILAVTPPPAPQ